MTQPQTVNPIRGPHVEFQDECFEIVQFWSNFQSMKSPVELNSLFSKFILNLVCYITWLDASLDDLQTRPLRQILLNQKKYFEKSLAITLLENFISEHKFRFNDLSGQVQQTFISCTSFVISKMENSDFSVTATVFEPTTT